MPSFRQNKNVLCDLDNIYVYLRARARVAVGRGRPERHEPEPLAIANVEDGCAGPADFQRQKGAVKGGLSSRQPEFEHAPVAHHLNVGQRDSAYSSAVTTPSELVTLTLFSFPLG